MAIGVNVTWLQCHAPLRSESKICCYRHFFVKISLLHIVRISALRWTEFHQNRKDPIREIQRFPNLGHNLCENDKKTLHDYKIRSFFSFTFFQGHNWVTNYPDSEFHGHWKTVTLSSISPNLSKHWIFLAFWPSLCFGSCLLFLVCHYKAFLFSARAMTTLGWRPNAHRDTTNVKYHYILSFLCIPVFLGVNSPI